MTGFGTADSEATRSASEPSGESAPSNDASGGDADERPPEIPERRTGRPDLPTKALESRYWGETDAARAREIFGVDNTRGVQYLSPEEAEAYRVFVHKGKLYNVNGELVNTADAASLHHGGAGRAIFVMDSQGNLYLSTQHKIAEFHHSSFLAGRPVAGAGEMVVENGRILLLTDRSGHYQPPPEFQQQVLRVLAEEGVDVSTIDVRSWWGP